MVSAPPMRKKTSWIVSGSAAEPAAGSGVPTETSTGELTGPASTMRPETFTPLFGSTIRAALPLLRDQRGEAEAEHDRVRAARR